MRAFGFCAVVGLSTASSNAIDDALLKEDVCSDSGVSLLQMNARKADGTVDDFSLSGYQDEQSPGEYCTMGVRGGRACCGNRCGTCGGAGCQNRPGGSACCSAQVERRNRRCTGARDSNCMVPREPRPTLSPTLDDASTVEEMQVCSMGRTLDLAHATVSHSNLGGAGPDGGAETLVYSAVFPNTDLVVSSTSPYTPNLLNANGGVLHNGLKGGFGVVNVACDGSVNLDFSFVDSTSGQLVTPAPFLFTWFDSDHGMAHESREAITVSGFSSYHITDMSSLDIREVGDGLGEIALSLGQGTATFSSTMRGGKVDNPISPLSLNKIQSDRTVALLFSGKSSFGVTLSETGYANPQGRNFFFSGSSAMVCAEDARCTSFNCPDTFTRRMDAEFRVCTSKPCTEIDTDNCCYADA